MPHYLWRGSYSAETWAALIKNPQNRRDPVRALVESAGGKLEALYYGFGEDDAFALVEFPDNVSAASVAVAIAASGAFKSLSTTVLMTAEEAAEAMRKAGNVGYRPPGA